MTFGTDSKNISNVQYLDDKTIRKMYFVDQGGKVKEV